MRRICSGLIPLHAASIESGSFLHRRLLHFERKKRLIPKDLLLFSMSLYEIESREAEEQLAEARKKKKRPAPMKG